MAKWIRFEQGGKTGFGTLEGDTIAVHTGDHVRRREAERRRR